MPNAISMVKDEVLGSIIGFDSIPIPMSILDPDGTVLAVNKACERFLGQSAGELVDRNASDVAPGIEYVWAEMIAHAREHGSYSGEITAATPHGPAHGEFVLIVREHAGRSYVICAALSQAATEPGAGRRDARAREEALALLAGGVAEAFNNQLVGVLAEASALRENPALERSTKDGLRRIEHAGECMADLTHQLLAYAGCGRSESELVDPDELVEACHQRAIRCLSPDALVRVTTSATRVAVEADRRMLRRVICNLVANGAEALTDKTGSISITTRVDGSNWVFEVSDTGAGMNSYTQARMFDPFFTTKRDHQGLGLSVAQGIVRQLGGEVSVDSDVGRGTSISVRLPIVPGARAGRQRLGSQPPAAVAPPPFRILVADDEPLVVSTVRRLLERRGADVVVAGDGAQARALLDQGDYQVLLFDVTMPELTGYQLVPLARQLQPNAKVILMSGLVGKRSASDDAPDAFLEKPFTAPAFDAVVDGLLA